MSETCSEDSGSGEGAPRLACRKRQLDNSMTIMR